ncbi:tRNA (adenosine(37)-N6)-threonylcarbamoyltransferase complex ATPase subunit type 1 TsaE [Kiloniella laminariae]|uniref:tRNA (adenosine(37)-N6)-threonylcarbamoyltransferase complex ATPase subunit type 1 TsaE n=1 Tax=Kiloniella laminariae TaxID=454162 RepID=UPI00035F7699|nr:tRNA (adenosine(37)-N6)-threonylcarbamoyltransferase complex ATPase subunit type 1 TsaE [Kiloniella laminariae]
MAGDQEIGQVICQNEMATQAFAARLAPMLRAGDVLALDGDLGAGKTAFSRALINAFPACAGQEEIEEVPSPTFTLVQVYDRGEEQIWHFDLYRLEDPEEAFELGIEEAFAEAICLIEWPEKLGRFLPRNRLLVKLSYGEGETSRKISLHGEAGWLSRLSPLFSEDGKQ